MSQSYVSSRVVSAISLTFGDQGSSVLITKIWALVSCVPSSPSGVKHRRRTFADPTTSMPRLAIIISMVSNALFGFAHSWPNRFSTIRYDSYALEETAVVR